MRDLLDVAFQHAADDIASRPANVSPPVTTDVPFATTQKLFSFHAFADQEAPTG
jgi:hypothetical protein